ncbi:hypothetical protein D3C84_516250 [compost metagenome]
MRAFVLAFAGKECRADRPGGVDAGAQVAQGFAAAGRAGFGEAGHAHQAGHGLGDYVVRGAFRQRPVLAEAGDAGVDQPRVVRFQRLEVDAQALGHAGAEVFDDHVRVRHQLIEALQVGGCLEVQLHATLATIDQAEVDALAIVAEGAQVATVVAMSRHLELDDLRPQVGQHRRAMRAGQHTAEVEHSNTPQRLHCGFLVWLCHGLGPQRLPVISGWFRPCSLAVSLLPRGARISVSRERLGLFMEGSFMRIWRQVSGDKAPN